MGQRPELHDILLTLVDTVYHQPPPGFQMVKPCIVYHRDDINIRHANNLPYKHKNRYSVTYIDANPDSVVPDQIAKLPLCSYDRHFKSDNLNHDVFTLYF